MDAPPKPPPSTGRLAFGLAIAPLSVPLPVALVTVLFPSITLRSEGPNVSFGIALIHVVGFSVIGVIAAYAVAFLVMLPVLSVLLRRGVNLSLALTALLALAVGVLVPLVITAVIALLSSSAGWEWSSCLTGMLHTVPCSFTVAAAFWLLSVHKNRVSARA